MKPIVGKLLFNATRPWSNTPYNVWADPAPDAIIKGADFTRFTVVHGYDRHLSCAFSNGQIALKLLPPKPLSRGNKQHVSVIVHATFDMKPRPGRRIARLLEDLSPRHRWVDNA